MQYGPDGAALLDTAADRREKEHAEEQRRDARRRNLQYWFNVIVAFSTVASAGIVLYQNRILDRTMDEMRAQSDAAKQSVLATKEAIVVSERLAREAREQSDRLTERSLAEAREARRASMLAVKAAQEANANNISAFQADQRPWLLVKEVNISDLAPSDKTIRADVVIQNFGKSPAMAVTYTDVMVRMADPSSGRPPRAPTMVGLVARGKFYGPRGGGALLYGHFRTIPVSRDQIDRACHSRGLRRVQQERKDPCRLWLSQLFGHVRRETRNFVLLFS